MVTPSGEPAGWAFWYGNHTQNRYRELHAGTAVSNGYAGVQAGSHGPPLEATRHR